MGRRVHGEDHAVAGVEVSVVRSWFVYSLIIMLWLSEPSCCLIDGAFVFLLHLTRVALLFVGLLSCRFVFALFTGAC